MKKYKFGLLAILFVFGLFIFNTNSVEALVPGCSSTTNYSATTGAPCSTSISVPAPEPEPEPVSICSNGVNTVTGFVCGCTSRTGWSSVNGSSCTGCDSTSSYNILTGASCSPTMPPTPVCENGYDMTTGFICGCTSNTGWSSTTGQSCGVPQPPFDVFAIETISVDGSATIYWNNVNGDKFYIYKNKNGEAFQYLGVTTDKSYKDVSGLSTTIKYGYYVTAVNSIGESKPSNKVYVISANANCSASGIDTTTGFRCGCTSINGYSSTTGASCAPHPTEPPVPVCTNGFDSTTGFRCGCTSTRGYSSYDGNSCSLGTFPPGCTSTYGYSPTTGEICSGKAIPIPMPNPTPIVTCTITSTLRLGSTGADVSCLQSRIGLISDGKFGPRTLIAVKAFQANAGLRADGVVGPKSISALEVSN